MKIADQAKWNEFKANNTDFYAQGVIDYAERWADLMEKQIGDGKTVAEIADATSHEADTDGITGFMYGMAVSTLAWAWANGEDLRRWHNIATQIGTEGEKANETGSTLNPALLGINILGNKV